MSRWLGPLHFTGLFWYRVPIWLARWAPEFVLRIAVPSLAWMATALLGDVRRAVAHNLELALGPATGPWQRWARVRRTFVQAAWCLIERNEQFIEGRAFDVEYEGLEGWDGLVGDGGAFVLATAHVGNWELGSTLPSTAQSLVVNVVREAEADERAQDYTARLVESLGGARYRTHFATDDMALGVELMAALRDGEIVALQADRPRSGSRTEAVPFLGGELPMPVGPAAIARLASVPVVPIFTLREGRRRYRVVIRPAIHVGRSRDRDADHRRALEQIAGEVAQVLRRAPHQWFCYRAL